MPPNVPPSRRSTSSDGTIIIFDRLLKTNIRGTGHPDQFPDDWEPELFPDDRADGPMSGLFRNAQRFADGMNLEDA